MFTTHARSVPWQRGAGPKRKRATTVTAVLAAIPLVLAGCSGGDDPGSDGSGEEPVSLRMTTWSGNEEHLAVLNAIADEFIAENPDLVGEIVYDPLTEPGQYMSTVTTQIAGGDPPDLIWLTEGFAAEFAASGVFYDLQPTMEETEGYDFGDLLPGGMSLWQHDGGTYGYPFSSSPFGLFANSDLIAAAGQADPRELMASGEWTWDAAVEIAAAVMESEGITAGIQLAGTDPYVNPRDRIMPQGLAWGARPWSEDGLTCEFNTPETIDYLTWYHEQTFDTQVFPAPGEAVDFASGQAAFRVAQLSASAGLEEAGFEWDFLQFPEGPVGAVPVVGQGGVGVIANSAHPDIAAKFLAFFSSKESAQQTAKFFPPPRESLLTVDVLAEAAPALSEEQIQTTVIDQALNATTVPSHPNLTDMEDTIRAGIDPLWTDGADIGAVLDKLCTDLEPSLAGD